jgi:hypothetical protein
MVRRGNYHGWNSASLSHGAGPRLSNQHPQHQQDLAGRSPGQTRGRTAARLLLQQALAQTDGGMRMAMLLQVDSATGVNFFDFDCASKDDVLQTRDTWFEETITR